MALWVDSGQSTRLCDAKREIKIKNQNVRQQVDSALLLVALLLLDSDDPSTGTRTWLSSKLGVTLRYIWFWSCRTARFLQYLSFHAEHAHHSGCITLCWFRLSCHPWYPCSKSSGTDSEQHPTYRTSSLQRKHSELNRSSCSAKQAGTILPERPQ